MLKAEGQTGRVQPVPPCPHGSRPFYTPAALCSSSVIILTLLLELLGP